VSVDGLIYAWSAATVGVMEMADFIATGGVVHLGMGLLAGWVWGLVMVGRP
jgi:hypothetical protein